MMTGNVHCVPTVVLSKQLNFKSAVIRSNRSSCLTLIIPYLAHTTLICKYEIKSQIFTVQMFQSFDQSRTQAVPSALRLRAESFSFNVFFKSVRP